MSLTKTRRLALVALIFFLAGVIIWQLFVRMTSAEPLTAQQASSKVESLYNGKIMEVQEENKLFVFELELSSGIYEIEVNRETGEIGRLTKIGAETANQANPKGQQENPATEPKETEGSDSSPTEYQNHLITEEEAKEIAIQQISGKVDELETKEIDGVFYYLVEVERQDGKEGTVQIHGVTGDVVSITWDD